MNVLINLVAVFKSLNHFKMNPQLSFSISLSNADRVVNDKEWKDLKNRYFFLSKPLRLTYYKRWIQYKKGPFLGIILGTNN